MTEAELLGRLRSRIGSPDKNEVSNLMLLDAVQEALTQLVDELSFRVVTDNLSIALVAGQGDYALPSDVLSILWVSRNDNRLEPFGLGAHDRDMHNTQSQTSGTPTQFAVRGRRLYLYPAPDSSAVSEDGVLSFSYVGAPLEMGPEGPTGLSDSDQWLLIHLASLDWCISHPSEMNAARVPGYQAKVEQGMARAKQRWISQGAGAAKHHITTLKVWTGGRSGGAR